MLVTGGTVFVSRYIAEYYIARGYDVYVLNRNTKEQSKGVKLIEADRNHIGEALRNLRFDVVIDTAYTSDDVEKLLDALDEYGEYILISSSAVYSKDSPQPFKEDTPMPSNKYGDQYGTNKIQTESVLISRNPNAYILRPAYLYGEMNNLYREAFVFDCALADRKFYLPKDGEMKLQFFHIHDLCEFIDILLKSKPSQRIFNMGNEDTVSIREWVELCYRTVGKQVEFVNVYEDIEQKNYFSFSNYGFEIDVSAQYELMKETKPLCEGLEDAFEWYKHNSGKVNKKPYIEYIDNWER